MSPPNAPPPPVVPWWSNPLPTLLSHHPFPTAHLHTYLAWQTFRTSRYPYRIHDRSSPSPGGGKSCAPKTKQQTTFLFLPLSLFLSPFLFFFALSGEKGGGDGCVGRNNKHQGKAKKSTHHHPSDEIYAFRVSSIVWCVLCNRGPVRSFLPSIPFSISKRGKD